MQMHSPYQAPADQLVSTREAAALLNVTPQAVRNLAREGAILPIDLGTRAMHFDRADVQRLAAARRAAPPKPGPRPKEPA